MKNSNMHCKKMSPGKKIAFGAMVMSAGVLLLLFNFGYLDEYYRHMVFSWQSALIAVGIVNLFSKDNWILGIATMMVGAFFLAPELTGFNFSVTEVLIPAGLILIGIAIIFKRTGPQKDFKIKIKESIRQCKAERGDENTEGLEEVNIFGGGKRIITEPEFIGGTIVNIFGGMELDLRQTNLKNEITVIETINLFGGLSMIVPASWEIKTEGVSILGGFADKRTDLTSSPDNKKLIIKGVNIFGGGEIKTTVWVRE